MAMLKYLKQYLPISVLYKSMYPVAIQIFIQN